MPEHPHLGTIRRYYEGCSTASRELMLSTFAPDIVHYFPDSPPVRGAETLADFWLSFFEDGRHAVWYVFRDGLISEIRKSSSVPRRRPPARADRLPVLGEWLPDGAGRINGPGLEPGGPPGLVTLGTSCGQADPRAPEMSSLSARGAREGVGCALCRGSKPQSHVPLFDRSHANLVLSGRDLTRSQPALEFRDAGILSGRDRSSQRKDDHAHDEQSCHEYRE